MTHNPLKLIFKVLWFALRNKYPQQLSALAYWNSNRCSRVDLAKTEYGGPFTTSQVEDVKTFFRILVLIILGSPFVTLSLYSAQISPYLSEFQGFQEAACAEDEQFGACFKKRICNTFWICDGGAVDPCVRVHPSTKLTQVKIFTQLVIGAFFVFVHMSGWISAEVVGHFTHNVTSNLSCMQLDVEHHCDSDQGNFFYWLSLLSVVYIIGQYLMLVGGIEYLCAKTPVSMKGLMFGSVFTSLGFTMILLHVLFIPFHRYNITVFGVTLGCVFWFLVTCTVAALLFIAIVILIGSCCYRKMQKDLDDSAEDDFMGS